jgi:hypothetical protein
VARGAGAQEGAGAAEALHDLLEEIDLVDREGVDLAGVDAERADHLAIDPDGQGGAAGEAARPGGLPPGREVGVGVRALRHRRSPGADGRAAGAPAARRVAPEDVGLRDVAVVHPGVGDGPHRAALVVLGDPHPGQRVAALGDQDAADRALEGDLVLGGRHGVVHGAEDALGADRPPQRLGHARHVGGVPEQQGGERRIAAQVDQGRLHGDERVAGVPDVERLHPAAEATHVDVGEALVRGPARVVVDDAGGEQRRHLGADQLRGGPAEEARRVALDVDDDERGVGDEDGVEGRTEEEARPPSPEVRGRRRAGVGRGPRFRGRGHPSGLPHSGPAGERAGASPRRLPSARW